MTFHSFHLAPVPLADTRWLLRPPTAAGLRHLEVMAGMDLGSPVVSPRRLRVRRMAMMAEWEDEAALEATLSTPGLGAALAGGWHVRLAYQRRWGQVQEFAQLPERAEPSEPGAPVVAITLARMRLRELPRFIRWGRPVERQVRDHPQATLALAAIRLPNTVSTFSIWTSTRAMTGMVWGRDHDASSQKHHQAMGERERRDFHHEFTTMRFRPLSEHGEWNGRSDYVPTRG